VRTIIAMSLAVVALLAPATARAAVPTLDPLTVTVSPEERSMTAEWRLPEGMRSYLIEIATDPETYASGDLKGQFLVGNVVYSQLLFTNNPTRYTFETSPGEPVYVHIAAYEAAASSCSSPYLPSCVKEFSEVMSAEIPLASPPGMIDAGTDARHLTAEWFRSVWHMNAFIEVATSSDVYPPGDPLEGLFLEENLVFYDDTLTAVDNRYRSDFPMPPGTFYVHVGTADVSGCCAADITDPLEVTILANPPRLKALRTSGTSIHAEWSLPPGVVAGAVELGRSPSVYDAWPLEGYFTDESLVLYDDSLATNQNSWDSDPLPAGRYYFHVGGYAQQACQFEISCVNEFTDPLPLDIGAAGPFPPPKVAADTTTAFASLSAPKRASARKLVVRAMMAEAGTITANGTVSVPGSSKVYRLSTVTADAAAGKPVKLWLKLSKAARKSVKKALRRHRRVVAKLTLTARDLAGNAAAQKRTVKLRP
jgi:hypothetical protein